MFRWACHTPDHIVAARDRDALGNGPEVAALAVPEWGGAVYSISGHWAFLFVFLANINSEL